MARCFHAAVHARHAASVRGDPSPEEVFIATLLSRIGELAFWCFSGETGQELDQALRKGKTPEKAESEVLGFRLRSLTQLLAREWALPGLVISACADNPRPTAAKRWSSGLRAGQCRRSRAGTPRPVSAARLRAPAAAGHGDGRTRGRRARPRGSPHRRLLRLRRGRGAHSGADAPDQYR
jgi:HD-like signal output (HDOD) protein